MFNQNIRQENKRINKIEINGHKSAVYVVKFSKDGNHIMSGSQDKTIKLWNPYKSFMIKSFEFHSQPVLDLAICQDNSKFASCGIDKNVYLTDSIKGGQLRRYFHSERVNTVAFNDDESVLISGSYDCSVRIWDLKSNNLEPIQILKEAKDSIVKVLINKEKIISASVDGTVRTYDIRKGTLQKDTFDFTINGFEISPDGKYSIISGLDNCIKLFENESGKVIKTFKGQHTSQNYTMSLKYTLDLDGILTTSENGDLVIYDLLNSDNNIILKGHEKASCGLDHHPNKNNILVSCGFDSKIILWDK